MFAALAGDIKAQMALVTRKFTLSLSFQHEITIHTVTQKASAV